MSEREEFEANLSPLARKIARTLFGPGGPLAKPDDPDPVPLPVTKED